MATSAQVIEAIKEARAAGWTVRSTGFGYRVTSPASNVDHPTPDDIPSRWWPGKTYRKLFVLVVNFNDRGRVTYAQTSVSPCPWVESRDAKVTFTKAIEFLRTDHGAE